MGEIEREIRKFLGKYISVDTLRSEENIRQVGMINSLLYVQLIVFLETNFNIAIPDEELEMRNFATLTAIVSTVERLRVASTANA